MYMALSCGALTIKILYNIFISHGEKQLAEFGELTKEHIMCLTNLINGCLPINLMLEMGCTKFIWNFFNKTHELHKAVAINCFYNQGSTLAEKIRYFMYKCNILIND